MGKIYGLVGEKLGHSLSPELHGYLGCSDYKLIEVSQDRLAQFIKAKEYDGLNITVPYKKTVMPLLSKTSETARRVGCVNTVIKLDNGKLYGDNTDVYGFNYLMDHASVDVENKKCIVLGNGGGAAAVCAVLKDRKAREIVTVTRNGADNFGNIEKHSDADVIINTTPVGMYPETQEQLINLDAFTNLTAVIDIVYNPLKTKLLVDAKEKGIKAVNGLSMLAAQAKRSRELFDGVTIDDSVLPNIVDELTKKLTNIVLIGMPGCGKSTVGAMIAEKTGKRHHDMDSLITRLCGKTPEKVIRQDGEKEFRRIEHIAAEWAGKHTGNIVSTGGGVVLRDDNMKALKQNGTVIFINRDTDKLDTSGRPISESRPISELAEERLPLYRKHCDYEVDNNGEVEKTVEKILAMIG